MDELSFSAVVCQYCAASTSDVVRSACGGVMIAAGMALSSATYLRASVVACRVEYFLSSSSLDCSCFLVVVSIETRVCAQRGNAQHCRGIQ